MLLGRRPKFSNITPDIKHFFPKRTNQTIVVLNLFAENVYEALVKKSKLEINTIKYVGLPPSAGFYIKIRCPKE